MGQAAAAEPGERQPRVEGDHAVVVATEIPVQAAAVDEAEDVARIELDRPVVIGQGRLEVPGQAPGESHRPADTMAP